MDEVLRFVADAAGARGARRGARIQSLWSGYGELFRVELEGASEPGRRSVVVKWARPPASARDSAGDARKRRSYQVETAFYRDVAPRCGDGCRVPRLLGSRIGDGEWMLVLEDLDDAGFDARQRRIDGKSLDACLAWLAAFHAQFLGARFDQLWPTGTYWHLATRNDELARIDDPALREAAPRIDALLEAGRYPTLVHGDAKEANFCFTRDGRAVAAVDFQYVGGGCAMKDVAYLLHGRHDEPSPGVPSPHLATYFQHLGTALGARRDAAATHDVDAVEAEWRRLYPVARLDFCRFLAGWAPEHWRGDADGQRFVARTLRDGTLD